MSVADVPFSPFNPAEFLRPWLGLASLAPTSLAPQALVQPILPGWTLNINSRNSSSPQTEAAVVAKHSYGRQLGRISDALHALIVERHGERPLQEPYAEFLALRREIEEVKRDSAQARLEQIEADLDLLKREDTAAYVRLREALRKALERTEG
jgi:hypothetical protein